MLEHPSRALAMLIPVALLIEVAQYRPEILPGGHAISEVVRNVAYGIIAAIIFEWLIIELPTRRRRQEMYRSHHHQFSAPVTAGPLLLSEYRLYRSADLPELDTWNKPHLIQFAQAMAATNPAFFGKSRSDSARSMLLMAQMALDDLRRSLAFFDPAVTHAISTFPVNSGMGLNANIVHVDADGKIEPTLDVHIAWELTVAARNLYAALVRHAPTGNFTLTQKMVAMDGQSLMLVVNESDLVAPAS